MLAGIMPFTIIALRKIVRIVTPSTQRFHWNFLAPRYWPIWLGLGLMKFMAALPFRWQLAIGGQTGRWIGKIARRRRRIAEINLELCFPELSPIQRATLLEEHFAALGIGLFETAMAWWARDDKLRDLARVEGLEHLQQALDRGKGVILLTGHFTPLELGARFITWHQPFHAMYRSHKNPLYETVMRRERERRSRFPPLPHEDLRGLLRAFKKGRAVWYAPDQNHGRRNSVFVPFFGIPACTRHSTDQRVTGALHPPGARAVSLGSPPVQDTAAGQSEFLQPLKPDSPPCVTAPISPLIPLSAAS